MKTRQGFVSNSSSTSFIVTANDLGDMKRHGIRCYKVESLIEIIKLLESDTPDFLFDLSYHKQLLEVEEVRPGCYITEPFDRADAFELGFSYSAFESDL